MKRVLNVSFFLLVIGMIDTCCGSVDDDNFKESGMAGGVSVSWTNARGADQQDYGLAERIAATFVDRHFDAAIESQMQGSFSHGIEDDVSAEEKKIPMAPLEKFLEEYLDSLSPALQQLPSSYTHVASLGATRQDSVTGILGEVKKGIIDYLQLVMGRLDECSSILYRTFLTQESTPNFNKKSDVRCFHFEIHDDEFRVKKIAYGELLEFFKGQNEELKRLEEKYQKVAAYGHEGGATVVDTGESIKERNSVDHVEDKNISEKGTEKESTNQVWQAYGASLEELEKQIQRIQSFYEKAALVNEGKDVARTRSGSVVSLRDEEGLSSSDREECPEESEEEIFPFDE